MDLVPSAHRRPLAPPAVRAVAPRDERDVRCVPLEEANMAEVTVFVDDAVRGTLPNVCAKDGVTATGRFRVTKEVGRSNRLGILWLLALVGSLGWLVLVYLLARDSGEWLDVQLPYSDEAYERFVAARRLRRSALVVAVAAGLPLLFVAAWAHLGAAGGLIALVVIVASLIVAVVADLRMERALVRVSLDASRRWVSLSGAHPAFADACHVRST